jgi:hypothetical protein
MANEITINANISVVKSTFRHVADVGAVQFTQSVIGGGNPGVITLAASGSQSIAWGTTSTIGWVWMRNLSTATTINLRTTASVVFHTFPAKGVAVMPRFTSTIWQVHNPSTATSAAIDIRGFTT